MIGKATPLEQAVRIAGSQSALARRVGVSQQYISKIIRKKGGRVPAELVVPISDVTGIPRQVLRPDLYAGFEPVRAAE